MPDWPSEAVEQGWGYDYYEGRDCATMTATALFLILSSAILHAAWNLIGKQGRMTLPLVAFLATAGAVASAWVFFVTPVSFAKATPAFYAALGGMAAGQILWGAALCRSYQAFDLSAAYPMVNALPLPLLACVTALGGFGKPLSTSAWCGAAAIFAGCLLAPMGTFADFRPSRFPWRGLPFVLTASAGTVIYTLCDSEAQRCLRATLDPGTSETALSLAYYAIRSAVLAPAMWLAVASGRRTRAEAVDLWRNGIRHALAASVCAVLSYPLVLLAMNFVTNVSYVQAFRQTGLLFGTVGGIAFLHERCTAPKLIGVALILAGLAAMLFPA